jgi:hypothetical protein
VKPSGFERSPGYGMVGRGDCYLYSFRGRRRTVDTNDLLQALFRWIHFVAGITWIGMLYFFNLINAHVTNELQPPDAQRSGAAAHAAGLVVVPLGGHVYFSFWPAKHR